MIFLANFTGWYILPRSNSLAEGVGHPQLIQKVPLAREFIVIRINIRINDNLLKSTHHFEESDRHGKELLKLLKCLIKSAKCKNNADVTN